MVKGTGSLSRIKPYRQPFNHFFTLKTLWLKVIHDGEMAKRAPKQVTGAAVERIWGGGPGFFQPTGKLINFLRLFSDFEFGIAAWSGGVSGRFPDLGIVPHESPVCF
jgi:hypothetical protein